MIINKNRFWGCSLSGEENGSFLVLRIEDMGGVFKPTFYELEDSHLQYAIYI